MTRLATYLRVLGLLADEGAIIVSSEELATASGVGSAKLRKDLSFLGPMAFVESATTSRGCGRGSNRRSGWIGATAWCWWGSATWGGRWPGTAVSIAADSRWWVCSTVIPP